MTKPKAPTLKQARKACLDIHSLIVRTRAGWVCEASEALPNDCIGPMQCAHVIPKKRSVYVALDVANGWCLCAGHHLLVDRNPATWYAAVNHTNYGPMVLYLEDLQQERKVKETRSHMMRYRQEVVRLTKLAHSYDVDLSPIPKHILKWVEAQ